MIRDQYNLLQINILYQSNITQKEPTLVKSPRHFYPMTPSQRVSLIAYHRLPICFIKDIYILIFLLPEHPPNIAPTRDERG